MLWGLLDRVGRCLSVSSASALGCFGPWTGAQVLRALDFKIDVYTVSKATSGGCCCGVCAVGCVFVVCSLGIPLCFVLSLRLASVYGDIVLWGLWSGHIVMTAIDGVRAVVGSCAFGRP
jgi:hypothetical protein